MKALILTTVSAFLFLLSFAAAHPSDAIDPELDNLLRKRQFLREDGMMTLIHSTEVMTIDTRKDILEKYQQNPLIFSGLNILVPSLGSWLQGDMMGGITLNLATLAVAGGTLLFLMTPYHLAYAMAFMVAGGGMAAVCVAGAVIPFFFAAYHNDRLRIGLGLKVALSGPEADSATFTLRNGENVNLPHFEYEVMRLRF